MFSRKIINLYEQMDHKEFKDIRSYVFIWIMGMMHLKLCQHYEIVGAMITMVT